MKIQLDYDTKTITLVDDVKLKEFFNKIKVLLPDWKDWNLNAQTVINWTNPITIPYYPVYPAYPYHWWENPVTYGTVHYDSMPLTGTTTNESITLGTYNLEIN